MANCPNCREELRTLYPDGDVNSPGTVYTSPHCDSVLGVTESEEAG